MTIANELQLLQTNLNASYDACEDKGATLPVNKNFSNLASCIDTIPTDITEKDYLVQVIDYDGTIIKTDKLNNGDTFTLPANPSHSGLVFEGWSSPVTITNNTITVTNSDITIGPMYHTSSGLSEFDITLNANTGLTVTLNLNGTKNWGDGTSDTLTTHTYANTGNYTITCDGDTMTTSMNEGLFGQTTSGVDAKYVVKARLSNNITDIGDRAFYGCSSLKDIAIPSSVVTFGEEAFRICQSLKAIIIPNNITELKSLTIGNCNKLEYVVVPNSIITLGYGAFRNAYSLKTVTIPESVTTLGNYLFGGCSSLTSITIPSSITTFERQFLYECFGIEKVSILCDNIGQCFGALYNLNQATINSNVTALGLETFYNNRCLHSITLPNSITTVGKSTFRYCRALTSVTLSNNLTSISERMFDGASSLTSIIIPSSVVSIGAYSFSDCPQLMEYDFSNLTSVPTLSDINAFTNINPLCKIKVPASLETQWKTANNWSTYADYIIGV